MSERGGIRIEPLEDSLRTWARRLLVERWGSTEVVSRGRLHRADELPGFVALRAHRPLGLLTYLVEGDACEIVSLDAVRDGLGVGSALLVAAGKAALEAGCCRLWLITTNDNLAALRFYQRRGFRCVALHADALTRSRELKPGIPELGLHGIPIRDEIELELALP